MYPIPIDMLSFPRFTAFVSTAILFGILILPAFGQTPFPYVDNVDNWSTTTSIWEPSSGSVVPSVDGRDGTQGMHLPGARSITMRDPVNLAGRSNPHFAVWAIGPGSTYTFLYLDVSLDGGQTWTQLTPTSGPSNSGQNVVRETTKPLARVTNVWKRMQWPLDAYAGVSIHLRIRNHPGNSDPNRYVVLDDFLIDEVPRPGVVDITGRTNTSLDLSWNASTTPDFKRYRIVVSTALDPVAWYESEPAPATYRFQHLHGVNNPYSGDARAWRHERRVIDITDRNQTSITVDDLFFPGTQYIVRLYEEDTQGFMNQGSDPAWSDTSEEYGPAVRVPFVENFDGGSTPAGWILERTWAVDVGDGTSDPGVLSDSPGGNYARFTHQYATVRLDLSSVQRPVLRFRHKHAFQSRSSNGWDEKDGGYLQYSRDGEEWTSIATFAGISDWKDEELDLSGLSGVDEGYLRFVTYDGIWVPAQHMNQLAGWTIEFIEVADNRVVYALPFEDDVEADEMWISSNGFSRLQRADSRSGSHVWSTPRKVAVKDYNITDNMYPSITLRGTVDLRSVDNPELTGWFRARRAGGGGYAYLFGQVSGDGGLSWTTLRSTTQTGASGQSVGDAWEKITWSLDGHQRERVLVRIQGYAGHADGRFEIDDLSITGGAPGAMTAGTVEFRADARACNANWDDGTFMMVTGIEGLQVTPEQLHLTDPGQRGVFSSRVPFEIPYGTDVHFGMKIVPAGDLSAAYDVMAHASTPRVWTFKYAGSALVHVGCGQAGYPWQGTAFYYPSGELASLFTVQTVNTPNLHQVLTAGLHPDATAGLDVALGEAEQPPFPPAGTFAARFMSNAEATLGQGVHHDLRAGTASFSGTTVHTLQVQRASTNAQLDLRFSLPEGVRARLQDGITGSIYDRDLVGDGTVRLADASIETYTLSLIYGEPAWACASLPLTNGWNLVSVPVTADDTDATAIHPGTTNHFLYSGRYETATTLEPGIGYWLRSPQPRTNDVCGERVAAPEIAIRQGWNLVGGPAVTIDAAGVGGAASIESDFFEYAGGYRAAETLHPGRGYWVKAQTAGTLVLGPSASKNGTRKAPSRDEAASDRIHIIVKDADGKRGVLYMVGSDDTGFELPPLPPSEAFDLRFVNDRNAAVATEGAHVAQIQGAKYPLTITASNLGDRSLRITDALGAGLVDEVLSEDTGLSIAHPIDRFAVSLSEIAEAGATELGESYPNPFASQTLVPFVLKEAGHVRLQVFDALGRPVATIIDEVRSAGRHEVTVQLPGAASGVYFVRMSAEGYQSTQRLVVLR
jgi:hypothetical protein